MRSSDAAAADVGVRSLTRRARDLFEEAFGPEAAADAAASERGAPASIHCAAAPGRVNLIGEHTDYTGGFVLPMAIGYSTVCYGRGGLVPSSSPEAGRCRVASVNQQGGSVVAFRAGPDMARLPEPAWANYVAGTVAQYAPDVPDGMALTFDASVAGDVPLGSGLSSSASLEVAVATFVEATLGGAAFRSSERVESSGGAEKARSIERALRCQRAENEWCDSPCGIMDQFVSSAARGGTAILIDCRIPDFEAAAFGGADAPVIVVCNSNVAHSIAGGEYPVRVAQCRAAMEALQKVNPKIEMLRDATMDDVEKAKERMDDVSFRRARHVVTENERTVLAKEALDSGDWDRMGELMNGSHESMKNDYEVSCEEIDVLVSLAQPFQGVFGSRLTGGGFGGCTVTLVKKERVPALVEHLTNEYKEQTGLECTCFETSPGDGARKINLNDIFS